MTLLIALGVLVAVEIIGVVVLAIVGVDDTLPEEDEEQKKFLDRERK